MLLSVWTCSCPLAFLDLKSSSATAAARNTKTTTPIPIPAFAPALRPPEGAFCLDEEDVVRGEVKAKGKVVAKGTVNVGHHRCREFEDVLLVVTAALLSIAIFLSPRCRTTTLLYWSPGYYTVLLAISARQLCDGIHLSHHRHLQDNMDFSTVGLYSLVFPRPADPHSSRYISRSSDKDHYPRTHSL